MLMGNSKVKQFIQNLGAPALTAEEIAIVKAHHEYHGDRQAFFVGSTELRACVRIQAGRCARELFDEEKKEEENES